MNQTWENGKKPNNFGPDFGLFGPYLGRQIFFGKFFPRYHSMRFIRKLMNRTYEYGKKDNFQSNFGPFGTSLGPKSFYKTLLSTSSCKFFQAIILGNLTGN